MQRDPMTSSLSREAMELARGRLEWWRDYGAPDPNYCAGSELFAADVKALLAATGWRTIDSAPKEHGHEILVAYDCPHGTAVVTWLSAEHVMGGTEDGFVSGWYISDGHNDPIWFRAHPYITHWMPLPGAPK